MAIILACIWCYYIIYWNSTASIVIQVLDFIKLLRLVLRVPYKIVYADWSLENPQNNEDFFVHHLLNANWEFWCFL